jgi:hypothetical protein
MKDIRTAQDDQGPDDGIYRVWSYCEANSFSLVRWHADNEKVKGLHGWYMSVNLVPGYFIERLKFIYRLFRGRNNVMAVYLDRKSMKELRDAIDHELNRPPVKVKYPSMDRYESEEDKNENTD